MRPFSPAAWAPGPHIQTLFACTLRPRLLTEWTRERMETDDGDFLDIDWGPDAGEGSPIVLILHGLEGSSVRRYVRNAGQEQLECGVRPVAMNFRGCSGEPNRALRFYHSGDTADAAWLLGKIRERFPNRPLGALGFSLGGNVLLKLMGERGDGGTGLLDAAVAVSVPYDLGAGSTHLEVSRMGRLYSAYFLRSLRRKVQQKADRLSKVLDVQAVLRARSIREFDERATAPLNGFAGATDYYARCSSNGFLSSIRVPTLLIHSQDDPFLPAAAVPSEAVRRNPQVDLTLSARGGHVGFLEGTPWAPRFWGEERAAQFFKRALTPDVRGDSVKPGP